MKHDLLSILVPKTLTTDAEHWMVFLNFGQKQDGRWGGEGGGKQKFKRKTSPRSEVLALSGLFAGSALSQERLQSSPHRTQSLPARRAHVLCDQQFHVKCFIWFSNSLSRLTCLVDNILTWYSSGKLWKLRAVWIPIRHKKTGLPKTSQIASRPCSI